MDAHGLVDCRGEALYRKEPPRELPVGPDANALFRLGEQCNNDCPMCTNSDLPALRSFPTAELLRRADGLRAAGLRRVVLTGGEPTIHPGFWEVVAHLRSHGIVWDINTHGRSFAVADRAGRAVAEGLQRAIVSLHSHEPEASAVLSGIRVERHTEAVEGIVNLRTAGADVTVNCVVSAFTRGKLADFLRFCGQTFGPGHTVKLAFPSLHSRGESWAPIGLRYKDVRAEVRALPPVAAALGLHLQHESFPACVLGDPAALDVGRFGFGETHYLDDRTGDVLFAMPWVEAQSAVYPARCRRCTAFERCPGVSVRYAQRFGVDELDPFPDPSRPWWL